MKTLLTFITLLTGFTTLNAQDTQNLATIGQIIRHDPTLDSLIAPDTKIEVCAGGFTWCEGPAWHPEGFLVFSEIPSNTALRWAPGKGISTYLHPSGYTGLKGYGKESGSNGLLFTKEGHLISCEHGDRRLSLLIPGSGKRTLADHYQGNRFNSPNDLTRAKDGTLYFTDPPYGLPKGAQDPSRELDFCGVYRLDPDGTVTLLTKEFTRPNGITLSPDETHLYVAQSDSKAPIIKRFHIEDDKTLTHGEIFYDTSKTAGKLKGLPDGLKCDQHGNLFATAPGGVLVLDPNGKLLGEIQTGEAVSNVAFGGKDGSELYLTSDMYLCRVKTLTAGK